MHIEQMLQTQYLNNSTYNNKDNSKFNNMIDDQHLTSFYMLLCIS